MSHLFFFSMLMPAVILAYILSFVQFAKRSNSGQVIERAVRAVAEELGNLPRMGTLNGLWLAATNPNHFFTHHIRQASVLFILMLLVLISLVQALPQFMVLARVGLLAHPSSLFGLSARGLFTEVVSGVGVNVILLVLMATVIRVVAKLGTQAWTVAIYALSPFVLIGAIDAAVTLLATLAPTLSLNALLTSGSLMAQTSPRLLSAVAFGGVLMGLIWIFLPIYLSLRTFHAGVLAQAPGEAAKTTLSYVALALCLGVVAALTLN